MTFDWYLIFNLTEFLATGLVSRDMTVSLEGIGDADVMITKGNLVSIVFRDVIMPILFDDENPFVREGDDGTYAVFKDPATENVYLGIEVEA